MTHFHVTLPSDSSVETYPENSISRYTTKLSDRIELDDGYEVGLAEFMYPHTWFNFDNSDEMFWLGVRIDSQETRKFVFKSGYYIDGSAFATDLNRQTARAMIDVAYLFMHVRFTFNPSTLKITIDTNGGSWLNISDEFMKFLGYPGGWPTRARTSMTASELLDLNRGLNLIYVYCDIAAFSIVGDVKTPLLRVCNISGRDGEVIRTIFTHPQYVPLGRTEFETIEINISDELGRPIPFMHGKCLVTLHFRPKYSFTT
jgi:hypothetical protein